ncbi:MAG: DNA-binding response regulator [Bacteroidetes bacterium RIFCSPLOWO2_12_FULL_31_6]|nr:MAG: DNA-binding response regulator [Bacteroidetes bacterium RIFCSPLOWO2_12_FULL_31_6]
MKAIIVDDERLAREELKNLLMDFPNMEIIAECDNAEAAITAVDNLKPDVVFLDIHMPGKDGFGVLEELDYIPHIIFVTAYDEYALKAFEVNALDYLLKPIQLERLKEAINKVKEAELESINDSEKLGLSNLVFVKDGEKCWFVKLADVPMFESEGNYVRVYFDKNKPLVLKSLNNLANRLDENVFFRANRKFIINLNWVEKIESWFNGGLMVKLKNGEQIEISRRQASKLKDMKSL